VFSATLGSGIAANPYIAFYMRVSGPGTLTLTWADDGGTTTVEKVPLSVA
jgi:sulfur-oxidizing protein SoxZ